MTWTEVNIPSPSRDITTQQHQETTPHPMTEISFTQTAQPITEISLTQTAQSSPYAGTSPSFSFSSPSTQSQNDMNHSNNYTSGDKKREHITEMPDTFTFVTRAKDIGNTIQSEITEGLSKNNEKKDFPSIKFSDSTVPVSGTKNVKSSAAKNTSIPRFQVTTQYLSSKMYSANEYVTTSSIDTVKNKVIFFYSVQYFYSFLYRYNFCVLILFYY